MVVKNTLERIYRAEKAEKSLKIYLEYSLHFLGLYPQIAKFSSMCSQRYSTRNGMGIGYV